MRKGEVDGGCKGRLKKKKSKGEGPVGYVQAGSTKSETVRGSIYRAVTMGGKSSR